MSLKLYPPAFFGAVILDQEIQLIFLLFGLSSHQNLVKIDWILLNSEMGSLKHDIEYEGIADNTDFRSTCLPARDPN